MLELEILCDNECGDEELPEFEEFLPSWLTYLGNKTERVAERLILEAADLLNGYGKGKKREELQKPFRAFPKDKSGNYFRYGSSTYFERDKHAGQELS